jgi:hypothetical protein
MEKERHFRIVFEAESGITDNIRVSDESELAKALIAILKDGWSPLRAGDTIKIIEEE